MGTWVVIGIVVLIVLWLVLTYNGLVTARNRTQEAWSEIDVELKRRHDLIPNLVNTVQGYVGHERGTLVLGSANWTLSGLGVNHELDVETRDAGAVMEYAGRFAADWDRSGG